MIENKKGYFLAVVKGSERKYLRNVGESHQLQLGKVMRFSQVEKDFATPIDGDEKDVRDLAESISKWCNAVIEIESE